jgi:23S rRNA (cytidine1920-2'-O)/16S rRNA (cytidine1409-2'-O)-methyltransferase
LASRNDKKRLDIILVEKKMVESRQRSQALILAGRVFVNDLLADKPGRPTSPDDRISVKGEDNPFVSRGGLKLAHGLRQFSVEATGLTCLDVGASTGGFTDCLLQFGAAHVFAVDVGYGQLAWSLRNDPRVTVIERSNIRYLDAGAIPSPIDLAVIDVSFISLKIVVPAILKYLKTPSRIIALIKPQFEVGKGKIGKGGIVRETILHQQVIEDLCAFFSAGGLTCESVVLSPISGAKGNKEFIISMHYPQ